MTDGLQLSSEIEITGIAGTPPAVLQNYFCFSIPVQEKFQSSSVDLAELL